MYKLSVTKDDGRSLSLEEKRVLMDSIGIDPDKLYDSPFGDAIEDIQAFVDNGYTVSFGPIKPIKLFGLDFYPPQDSDRMEFDISEGDMVAHRGYETYILSLDSSDGSQTVFRYFFQKCAGKETIRIRETYRLIDVTDA